MKVINVIIFILLVIFLTNEEDNVINTCGVIGYTQPKDSGECKSEGEICCFVKIKNEANSSEKSFCVSSPSLIDIKDVKEEIEKNTGFKLENLVCNYSNFMKSTLFIFLLLFLF